MKQVIKYQCEICGKLRDTMAEAQTCEASHFGLTHKEYLEWKKLSRDAVQAGRDVGICKNQETDAAFDKAIQELVGFEKRHGITAPGQNRPSDFCF